MTRRTPCPVCGKPDNCNIVAESGDIFCRRVESDRPGNGGWFHQNPRNPHGAAPRPTPRLPAAPPAEVRREPAPPEVLDRLYRRLLAACPLSAPDLAHLRARGLSDEQIGRHGYTTLPADGAARDRLAGAMLAGEPPETLGHVPGIHRRGDGRPTVAGSPGMLVPVMQDGLVVGIQIRRGAPREGRRYEWLSTPTQPDGCGSGAPAHAAMPKDCRDASIVVVTEGAIKANIAADRLGRPVIAVPGVSITADVLPLLAQLGAEAVWMAYDADAATNPAVAQAERTLIADVTAQGYAAHRLTWPASRGKGIDDALAAGTVPVAVAVNEADNRKDLNHCRRLLEEAHAYTAALFAASNSRTGGTAARIAAAAVHDLRMREARVGEWMPLTNARLADRAGVGERTASGQKHTIATTYGGALEIRIERIPGGRAADGTPTDPHDVTMARLTADPTTALVTISSATADRPGNNHGGKRTKRPTCPTCGPDAGVSIESRYRCETCAVVIAADPPRTVVRAAEPAAPEALGGGKLDHPPTEVQGEVPLDSYDVSTVVKFATPPPVHPAAALWAQARAFVGMETPAPADRYTDASLGGRP